MDVQSFLQPFGLEAFRPGQREVIETVLAGEDKTCSRPETVWSRTSVPASPSYMTGLGSLVNTLINPLAQRRTSGVDADH